jgi:hypothetical protein
MGVWGANQILAVVRLTFWVTVTIIFFVFLAASILTARFLYALDHSQYADKIDELTRWVKRRKAAITQTRNECTDAKRRLAQWVLVHRLRVC